MARLQSLISGIQSLVLSPIGLQVEFTCTRTIRTLPRSLQGAFLKEKLRPSQEVLREEGAEEDVRRREIVSQVNQQLEHKAHGRLFAVVHLMGKQRRVTDGDLIVMEGHFPPLAGDRIRLEKVLLVGSNDFTLLGRPILRPDLVRVEATVVEKNLSHTKCRFLKKKRTQFMKSTFMKFPLTTLRITSVEVIGKVDELPDVEGVEGRTF